MSKPDLHLKSAWIITWEWIGDAAAVVDRVAGILNSRTSQKRVIDIVEFLYALHIANLEELAAYAQNKRNSIWRAEVDFNGRIRCGRHPSLFATYVKNIEITVDPATSIETITWETLPTSEPTDEGPKIASGPMQDGFTRRITGPLSFEAMWDRRLNRFKDKFLNRDKVEE